MAHISGLVAAGIHPSPVESADIVRSTTHKTLRGPRGGIILGKTEMGKALNSAVFPNMQGGPLEHTIAAKAVAFKEAAMDEFVEYQKQVVANAKALAESLRQGGLRLVSGGTDNHMTLVDVPPIGISAKQAEESLGKANIVINRNAIPFDTKPPRQASGISLGTPAITSRGMKVQEATTVGKLILKVLTNVEDPSVEESVKHEILELTSRFPVPGINS